MALKDQSVPSISISLALNKDLPIERFSPFVDKQPLSPTNQEESYRPSLSLSPAISSRFHRQPSPLRPADAFPSGKGLDRGRFEALLASTKERNAILKKEPDLRKELALKAHKSKQMERRALFLSKVNAPPSPTAAGLPKTPPDSPSIFHYSLPSPGLVSPLALFQSLQQKDPTGTVQFPSVRPWIEQVEYRRLKGANVRPPSLEQITAHLSSHGHSTTAKDEPHRPPIPLPSFLRAPSRVKDTFNPQVVSSSVADGHSIGPGLQITTTVIPQSSCSSPTELTEHNLVALNSRTLTSRDMMSKIKRRTSGLASVEGTNGCSMVEDERRARRISAPAELPRRERSGFEHPVLALPGAFDMLLPFHGVLDLGISFLASTIGSDFGSSWFSVVEDGSEVPIRMDIIWRLFGLGFLYVRCSCERLYID
ncbi:hypothetical protein B0F90DRAFT_93776 [Multifurca ochricompacta]|uniref:Uncharacterized protein n=1 Tax=Multifurca ochricompacta TaxID=376703 RepID=A0AAD4MCN9_9AGAM|nr:hypothetical protein B0F90DRAFT_93776 [Multifurca ochricompacta]